jgi:CBS domain-containing protein
MPHTNPLKSQLAIHRIWSQLSTSSRDRLLPQFTTEAIAAGTVMLGQGELPNKLGWILSGEVQLSDPDLQLSLKLGPGDLFGYGVTPAQQLPTWQALAAGDCQIAWLPPEALLAVCEKTHALCYFFPSAQAPVADGASASPASADTAALNLLSTPIRSLIKRPPITLSPQTTVQAAASLMRELGVSSVLLVEDGKLDGLITDRDLRRPGGGRRAGHRPPRVRHCHPRAP